MDNKIKILCVAIAVLLVSNGYLLYRVGNGEGNNEESKAKDNTPIGKYIPVGEGLEFDEYVINKLYLRDDGKVEINDKLNGSWWVSEHKGHYDINCKIGLPLRLINRKKYLKPSDKLIAQQTAAMSHRGIYVKVDDKYLTITGLGSYMLPTGNDTLRFIPAEHLTEKNFIRYKRVE